MENDVGDDEIHQKQNHSLHRDIECDDGHCDGSNLKNDLGDDESPPIQNSLRIEVDRDDDHGDGINWGKYGEDDFLHLVAVGDDGRQSSNPSIEEISIYPGLIVQFRQSPPRQPNDKCYWDGKEGIVVEVCYDIKTDTGEKCIGPIFTVFSLTNNDGKPNRSKTAKRLTMEPPYVIGDGLPYNPNGTMWKRIYAVWEIKIGDEWKELRSLRFVRPSESSFRDCFPFIDIPDEFRLFYIVYHTDNISFQLRHKGECPAQ